MPKDPSRDGPARVRYPQPVRALAALWVVVSAGYAAWLLIGSAEYEPVRDLIGYTLLLVILVGLLIGRAVMIREERAAWLLLAVAIAIWTASDVYYTVVVSSLDSPPFPTAADVGYLVSVLPAYAAVALLLLRRILHPPVGVWLDGLLVACGVAAFMSLILPVVAEGIDGGRWAIAMSVATPSSDLILACLVAGAVGLLGIRAHSTWWLLLAGALLLWATDTFWLLEQAMEQYAIGAPLDLGWLLSFALMALAAWRLPVPRAGTVHDHAWSALPLVVAIACFGLLVVAALTPIPALSVTLAAATVVVGVTRTALSARAASVHAELRKQAYLDDLTGLANRRRLTVSLGGGMTPEGALLLLDVDDFRQVNDSLGHAAGDEVLRQIAPRLAAQLREEDLVARLGGDEFAVFLTGRAARERAFEIGDRLRSSAAGPMRVHGVDLQVDVSVGVALSPEHGQTLEELLRCADAAIFRAKHSHEGVTVFEPALDSADRGQLLFMQELRQALASDEVFCVYQPQIELAVDRVVGVEALVRWHHPQRGELGPAEFLSFAEHTALIKPLTERVLAIAIAQLGEWLDSGLHLTMSVNLSAASLLDPQLPGLVARLAKSHEVPPQQLVFEITETMFMDDAERAGATVSALRELGAQISIDDYGTGFSSLGQVSALNAQELKLDMSFVTGVSRRPDLQSIMSATVLLAHGLGLSLVAEGVESAADLAMVAQLGCDSAQGFHICPPMAPVDAGVWLRRRSVVPVPSQARRLITQQRADDRDRIA